MIAQATNNSVIQTLAEFWSTEAVLSDENEQCYELDIHHVHHLENQIMFNLINIEAQLPHEHKAEYQERLEKLFESYRLYQTGDCNILDFMGSALKDLLDLYDFLIQANPKITSEHLIIKTDERARKEMKPLTYKAFYDNFQALSIKNKLEEITKHQKILFFQETKPSVTQQGE